MAVRHGARRASPPSRRGDQRRLTELDLLGDEDDASDGSDSPDERSSTSDITDAVVSRVHAGIGSLEDMQLGRDRAQCSRVVQMNLFGNRIRSLDGLQRFTRLEELCLSNNQIEELSFHELDPLKVLRVLDLSANQLSSLRGLSRLPQLEELSIAHNRLTGLDGLVRPVKLPKLRYLDVRGNQLASPVALLPLQHLKRLAHLRLQSKDGAVSNPICDLDEYPDALLEFLPTLKQLDEEDVALLRELSRVRMPKYHSAARRIQNQSARGVDGSSQTTPAKPTTGEASAMRVFAESRERLGYEVSRDGSEKPAAVSTAKTPRERPGEKSGAARSENRLSSANPAPQPARVVLREIATNTDLDFDKAILDRETLLLEKQAMMLAREQEFLRKETEFFAREKEQQDMSRQLQGQLTSSLERTAKLEAEATQINQRWEDKLQELESSRKHEAEAEADHVEKFSQLHEEVVQLQRTNESLQVELKTKDDAIARLQEEASRSQADEAAAAKDASTRVTVLQAELKETQDRSRDLEHQLRSQHDSYEGKVQNLTLQLGRMDSERQTLATQIDETEKRLHDMKTSRDQFRDECLHKDDELYRLKKALFQKAEEVEERRVQIMKAAERQDRMQQQQQQLYEKQLQASVIQLEMEFRKEHQQATEKLQTAYRKYQEALRQQQRLKSAYESSLKRESLLKDEIHRLSAIIEGDKEKLVDQELTKRAEYEFQIQRLRDEKQALSDELLMVKEERAKIPALQSQLDDSRQECERLQSEIQHLKDVVQTWEAKEGDWKAVIKVKDTMLNDQLRQLEDLRKHNKKLEDEYQQDTGEFQGQIEDLEEALDESLQKVERLQEKYHRVKAALAEKEESTAKYPEKLDDLTKEIELKNAALELIEGEMDRMRDTLSKQDELFQKRLQKHLESHREELEQARVSKEELDAKLRAEVEQERAEWKQKYDALAEDLKDMAAQNTKLRVALEQERKKNIQSDKEMRVLLAQLDRERHIKNERLGDIKRLFEQLQQESP